MNRLRLPLIFILVALSASSCAWFRKKLPGEGEDKGKTVIYRDTWGIPHIYSPTVEGGCYAMGWAQAEDRPEALLKNLLRGIGEVASVEGPGSFQSDLIARLWDNYGVSERRADENSPETRSYVQAFAKGVNDFYAAHPEDVPEWWGDRKVDEFMVTSFGRLFLHSWSIDDGFGDLGRGGIEPGFPETERASNQLAIAPERSAEGAAILIIDPHLSWWGASRFWEFRIHAGKLKGSGVTLAGFPTIGLGHNEHLAWAMTTGGPDTADIYELTLNPENPTQYRYDGEWRTMTSRDVEIQVKGEEEPRRMTLRFSHHGPVVAMKDGKAYAAAMAYADEVKVLDAWFEFNFGTDYQGAVRAMDTLQIFPQNIMVADTSGNIYYQRTGRVPRRPEGYDWSRPVDGSTSATEWDGFHPASDHVQILNPPQGYMQNCNIPPDAMMIGSPFDPEKTVPYIFSDLGYGRRGGWSNPRGARAVELLAANDSVTVEDAMAIILDVHPYSADRWLGMLREAHEKFGEELASNNPDYAAGMADVAAWNGELRRDSSAALKYYYWRKGLVDDYGAEVVDGATEGMDDYYGSVGEPGQSPELTDQELQAVVNSFASSMAKLKEKHGALDAVYGDEFRVGREGQSWPVGGGGRYGTTTLRNVNYSDHDDGTQWGRSGQTSTQVVVMSKPIQSWTAIPVGESDRPDSPHFADQAEKVFSERRLKSTWWTPKALAKNIESRLELPQAPRGGS